MSEIVQNAIRFATEAHQRIDQRRKYSNQPYSVHLERVAEIVSSVTNDEEMIASAWLHDVVEDTPATLEDIEREFGLAVSILVRELTDVSRPGDGNRAIRKEIDRQHLAKASARGQTIKLADLIDNCVDITKHDVRFAKIYLMEMESLLDVLLDADETLMKRARKTLEQSYASIKKTKQPDDHSDIFSSEDLTFDKHFKRQYNDIFMAKDIAESLLSFNEQIPVSEVRDILSKRHSNVATTRKDGEVVGYVALDFLGKQGVCGRYSRDFFPDQVLSGEASLAEVIHVLTRHECCFVSILGQIQGVVSRDDINKPYVRMWLFGIITLTEIRVTELIKTHFNGDEWQKLIPETRLKLAIDLQKERQRQNQFPDLMDCLQLADKGLLLIKDAELLSLIGFTSKSAAKKVIKQFQSLRNNLAHAQDISTYDWAQIARMSMRMLE
jgi:HD domain